MRIDDCLVVTAELDGMRRLARLPRPQVRMTQEDVPGASCIWSQPENGDHRDLVRLRPESGVPLIDTLRSIRASTRRVPGGGIELRGVESSFLAEAELLQKLGGRENTSLPRALMARRLDTMPNDQRLSQSDLSVTVADDAQSLAKLRVVVGQVFADAPAKDADDAEVERDFFHAPGVMTYLAVHDHDSVVSTGSILIIDGVANVWSVATLPSARGKGAATAIMEAVCLEARRQGAVVAALRTTDELARDGGLYNKVGFELLGHERIWELDDVDQLSLS